MFDLFPDQQKVVDDSRIALRSHRRVFVQAPTAFGKTVFAGHITRRMVENGYRVWFVAPRKKLVKQASETFSKFGIRHGRITGTQNESKAFDVHVAILNTLCNRLDEIQRAPGVIVFDEAHTNIDRILAVMAKFPDAICIFMSATPERLDGRGLIELAPILVEGPQLSELVKLGRLSIPRYFFPDLGLDRNHITWNGNDPNEKELAELFAKQKVYGKTIDLYRKHADFKPTILFERSIKSAKFAAAQFRDAGYNFQCVDGTMSDKKLDAIFDGFKRGEITGLTSSDLLTYGVDLPLIECLIMLRMTKSVALYFQMIGRGLRLAEGKNSCVILDQVNNIGEFGYPLLNRKWNFYGDGSGGIIEPSEKLIARQCPEIEYMWCDKPTCAGCEHYSGKNEKQKPVAVVDCDLQEYKHQEEFEVVKKQAAPAYQKDLNETIERCRRVISAPDIARMVKYAKALGEDWRWIYDQVNAGDKMINVGLLSAICTAYGYRPGWVYHKQKEMRDRR